MAFAICKDAPMGRVYYAGTTRRSPKWCNDVNESKIYMSKSSADHAIVHNKLDGAASLPVIVRDPEPNSGRDVHVPIPWTGLHELWANSKEIVVYIPKKGLVGGTGNYCLNAKTLDRAREIASERGLELRILLGVDPRQKTFHELFTDIVDTLSLRSGGSGPYYLISEHLYRHADD